MGWSWRLSLVAALVLAGCGNSPAPADAGEPVDAGPADAGAPVDAGPADAGPGCTPGGDGGYRNQPFAKLSDYCLVSIEDGGVAFSPEVMPYDLNTPLFSDYAVKVRGAWLPPGTAATYSDADSFAFPPGTILTKSFGFRDDFRKAEPAVQWVETRLLINTDAGWRAYTYVWDDGGNEASLLGGGQVKALSWIDADGGTVTTNYLVPSLTQCKQCHADGSTLVPIGPKARNLNRDFAYATGSENQLAHWTEAGLLTGAPADPAQAPRLAAWNDPSSGTLDARARAYLEVNCAHCHSAGGYARTTGLFLWASETDPTTYGICKPPVAAGPATGGFAYDVVPGDPEHSIMIHRMTSNDPGIAMPLIGRSVVDVEGTALVSDWIAGLSGSCP